MNAPRSIRHAPRSNGHADTIPFRTPPHNPEAEGGVLGGLILDPSHAEAVRSKLRAEDFFRDVHQELYRAILAVVDSGRPPDSYLVAEELRVRGTFERVGGDDLIEQVVTSIPHAENTLYYADIVRQKAIQRNTIAACERTIDEAYSNSIDSDELGRRHRERIESTGLPDPDPDPLDLGVWPMPPGQEARHGPAGEIVDLIEPHTEADPAAILIQFLVAFGNLIGRSVHWRHEANIHHLNLFACIVGDSAKVRKGTSWKHVRRVLESCDPEWATGRIVDGLSSGEGLIHAVRDPRVSKGEVIEEGVTDKRLLVVASEFGEALTVQAREGNTLSSILRKAWDSDTLQSLTKRSPARATGAHVSVIGHITSEELSRKLCDVDAANGYANRFLWACSRRSKSLPHGGQSSTSISPRSIASWPRRLSSPGKKTTASFSTTKPTSDGSRSTRTSTVRIDRVSGFRGRSPAVPRPR